MTLQACKKETPTLESFIKYEFDGEHKNVDGNAYIYPDNSILIHTWEFTIYIKKVGEATFVFNKNTYDRGRTGIVKPITYSANFFEEDQGYITITDYDENNQMISGEFSFEGSARRENTTVEVLNGTFLNIPLEKKDKYYSDGEMEMIIDGVGIKNSDVEVHEHIRDSIPYLNVSVRSLDGSSVSIYIRKSITSGDYEIPVINGFPTWDKVFFFYKKDLYTTSFLYPKEGSRIVYEEVDFENKRLKANLTGRFATEGGEEVNVEKLKINLHWD